jgi:hypothetical protein
MVPTMPKSGRHEVPRALASRRRYACAVFPIAHRRLLATALAISLAVAGCYSTAEPSFHPGNQRDILQALMLRGIDVTDPIPGQTACDDPDLVGNALYFTARMPGEEEYRDVYVHSYREKWWDRSKAEVDGCQEAYAQDHPGAKITRLDIPLYRVFGADWSDELTDQLTRALETAAEAGKGL